MSRAHRYIGWLACMTVAVCSVGVPLPAQAVKKSGDPFPCQHCACGCTDAESCWRNCCCHTNREKLAWARRHGVTPPAFVIAAARRESCCDEGRAQACCSTADSDDQTIASATPPCCSKSPERSRLANSAAAPKRCPRCTGGPEDEPPQPPSKERDDGGVVLLIAKLRCSGLTLSLSLLPPSIAPRPVALTFESVVRYEHAPPPALLYEPPFLPVAAPPPDARVA